MASTLALAGRVVVVTGAARGIGRATAAAALSAGARVAVGDLDQARAERAAHELGGPVSGMAVDVSSRGSFEAFLDQAESTHGPLDVLVNNAGVMLTGSFLLEDAEHTDLSIDVNLRGVLIGSQLAAQRMRGRGGGHIVNVASMAGKTGFAGAVTYCATKYGVVGLSEALRAELRDSGVAVSVVMPGAVKTDLTAGLDRRGYRRRCEPEDVAAAIVNVLATRRFEVYVPAAIGVVARTMALTPRALRESAGRLLGTDKYLMAPPDPAARATYYARVEADVAAGRVEAGERS